MDGSRAAELELARRCAAGDAAAWERFVREYRPVLYRAADALDRSGGAREVADSLYAELYGIKTADGERQSLFRYFGGRSSLAAWLRAVLAQRFVDRMRAQRRLAPLPVEDPPVDGSPPDPERSRYAGLLRVALTAAIGALGSTDRLRLACYYVQQLTLAQTGRLLREHEATVSRHLARTRRAIRESVERELRSRHSLTEAEIAECFESAAQDPGPLDLEPLLGTSHEPSAPERSL